MSGLYVPPHGGYPQELPDRWKFEDGTVRTDLKNLSSTELNSLGWRGPIEIPPHEGYYEHDYIWNADTLSFDAVDVDEFEKRRRVDYKFFWERLFRGVPDENTGIDSGGIAYKKIKSESKTSLEVNVIATELIGLINDAKQGDADEQRIQEVLNEIINAVTFTSEEFAELQTIFVKSGMSAVYTLQ